MRRTPSISASAFTNPLYEEQHDVAGEDLYTSAARAAVQNPVYEDDDPTLVYDQVEFKPVTTDWAQRAEGEVYLDVSDKPDPAAAGPAADSSGYLGFAPYDVGDNAGVTYDNNPVTADGPRRTAGNTYDVPESAFYSGGNAVPEPTYYAVGNNDAANLGYYTVGCGDEVCACAEVNANTTLRTG